MGTHNTDNAENAWATIGKKKVKLPEMFVGPSLHHDNFCRVVEDLVRNSEMIKNKDIETGDILAISGITLALLGNLGFLKTPPGVFPMS